MLLLDLDMFTGFESLCLSCFMSLMVAFAAWCAVVAEYSVSVAGTCVFVAGIYALVTERFAFNAEMFTSVGFGGLLLRVGPSAGTPVRAAFNKTPPSSSFSDMLKVDFVPGKRVAESCSCFLRFPRLRGLCLEFCSFS